jgi:hypothetical protein
MGVVPSSPSLLGEIVIEGVGVALPTDDVSSLSSVPIPARRPSDCASRRLCSVRSSVWAALSTGKKGSLWRRGDRLSDCASWREETEETLPRRGEDAMES